MYKVPVDHNLMESNVYRDPSFPLEFYYDDYGALVDHTLNCHWHPDIEMEVVLQGAVDFYLNGVLVPLTAGQCVFVNSGTLHMAHQRKEGGRALVFGFTFRPELFSREYPHSGFHKYFPTSRPVSAGTILPLRGGKSLRPSTKCGPWTERIFDMKSDAFRFSVKFGCAPRSG